MVPGVSFRTLLGVLGALAALAALAYAYRAGQEKAALAGRLREMTVYAEGLAAVRDALQANLTAVNAANEANAQRAAADMQTIARLQELADATPENSAACLDADAARRVRDVR